MNDSKSNPNSNEYEYKFDHVFPEELTHVSKRRQKRLGMSEGDYSLPNFEQQLVEPSRQSDALRNTIAEMNEPDQAAAWEVAGEKYRPGLVGLALSGGGIRSATFNLGIVQVLNEVGLFKCIDYLSTVSGGGCLGTYLSSYFSNPERDEESLEFPFEHKPGAVESDEMRHLRNNSDYLAPDGFLDALSIPVVLARGILINFLVILPYLLVAALLMSWGFSDDATGRHSYGLIWESTSFPATMTILGAIALYLLYYPMRQHRQLRKNSNLDYQAEKRQSYLTRVVFISVVAAIVAFIELQPTAMNFVRGLRIGEFTFGAVSISILSNLFSYNLLDRLGSLSGKIGLVLLGLLSFVAIWLFLLYLTDLLLDRQGLADLVIPSQILLLIAGVPFAAYLRRLDIGWLILVLLVATYFPSSRLDIGLSISYQQLYIAVAIVSFWYTYVFVDINFTGIHKFYRDRLSNAYVDAYVAPPAEDGYVEPTRIAPAIFLEDLSSENSPYHLLNAAINVERVDKENRFRNGRKSSFFIFSKAFCGGVRTGYFPTAKYWDMTGKGVDIATAMSISAAAVAPNMGKQTNKSLTFILSLLNLRLNYWFPNPRKLAKKYCEFGTKGSGAFFNIAKTTSKWIERTSNRAGPLYLIREMLGKLKASNRLVNLSDGGHIENLAIYELLRRQCRLIIAGDGEADPNLSFNGLAEVIRMARIDFGIIIIMDGLDEIRAGTQRFSQGKIYYQDGRVGHLLYLKLNLGGDYNLKATLTEDQYRTSSERDDDSLYDDNPYIAHYREGNPTFPHQSTGDQFFDEVQFESYRALGHQVARVALMK